MYKGISRILIYYFLFCSGILAAQEFTYTLFDRSKGFDRNYVNDIIRDSRGFFWIATDRGILRFDGNNITEFPDPGASTGNVLHLRLSGNKLFLIYEFEGIGEADLATGSFRMITRRRTADMHIYSSGDRLVYYADGMLVRFRAGMPVDSVRQTPDHTAVLQCGWGKVFVKNEKTGVHILDSATLAEREIFNPGFKMNYRLIQGDGTIIYQSDGQGYLLGKDDKPRPFRIPFASVEDQVDDFIQINDSLQFWIRGNRELVVSSNGIIHSLQIPGRRFFEFRNLHVVDQENGIVGLSGGFLYYRFGSARGYSFNTDQPEVQGAFRVRRKIISLDPQRQVLLGNPGFLIRQNDKLKYIRDRYQLSTYDGITQDESVIATSESDTLYQLNLRTNRIGRLILPGITTTDKLFNISRDEQDGTLIIGGDGFVFRFDFKRGAAMRYPVIGKSASRVIERAPASGHWWVGTTNGLYELDSNLKPVRSFHKSAGQLQGATISDLLFTGKDSLWLAHESGAELLDLKQGTVVDRVPAEAFADPRVTAILPDAFGRIWLSTFNGLICFNRATREIIRLGVEAGLINSEYNYQSALTLPDGRLMFGGLAGYDVIDPVRYLAGVKGGQGVIAGYERIGSDGSGKNFILSINPEEIFFDTETEAVRIYLSTEQPITSSSNLYEYRINKGQWTSVEGLAHIDVQRFSPGRYTFEFRGYTPLGGVISFPSVELIAQVVFYKSRTFLVVISALVTTLLLVVIFLIRRGREREREIKENISMDLHDEVGTILTKALIASRMEGGSEAGSRVQEYLREGLHSLRVFINTMNRKEVSLSRLQAEIQELFSADTGSINMQLRTGQQPSVDIMLPAELYRDVKLCVFELANNAVKHSGATRFEVEMIVEERRLALDIADDGCLTDLSTLENRGSGVRNMQKRAAKHDGRIEMKIGKEGHGLRVRMECRL